MPRPRDLLAIDHPSRSLASLVPLLFPSLIWGNCTKEAQEKVRGSHVGIGRRIVRVELNGLVVIINALLQIELIQVGVRLQISFISFWVYRLCLGERLRLRTTQPALNLFSDCRGDVILQSENVTKIPFVRFSPE